MVRQLLVRIVKAKQLPRQGQRISAVRIHNQEFFFNTKSTHMLSVTDESDSEGPQVRVRAQADGHPPAGKQIRPRDRHAAPSAPSSARHKKIPTKQAQS